MSNSTNPPDNPDGTRVDLGDDLLEKTSTLTPLVREGARAPELIGNARILLNEGMPEEAKKLLRRVLVLDSKNVEARERLDEIHELELKQIFGTETHGERRRSGRDASAESSASTALRSLDRDFNLGFFGPDGTEFSPAEAIFDSDSEMEKLGIKLDEEYRDFSAMQRIDIGIAYLEMGFYRIALLQFEAASHDDMLYLAGVALQAHTLILMGKAFEATLLLSALVRDSGTLEEKKLEPYYLLGRAHEVLQNPGDAKLWYEKAQSIDPHYRDVEDRLKRPSQFP